MSTANHPAAHHRSAFITRLAFGVTVGVVACILGMSTVTPAHAQSTTGSIFGFGPARSTVTASGNTGVRRTTTINDKGRYTLGRLGLGKYTVTLQRDGKVVDTRLNIPITVGRSSEVDFFCPHDQCAASDQTDSAR